MPVTKCVVLLGTLALGASMSAGQQLRPSESQANRWQADMDRFAEADAQQTPPADAVLFVGSSSIRLWNLDRWFPGETTINRGFGGSQICDSTHFAEQIVVSYQPRVIVFYAGDNDIAAGKSPQQVHVDFRAFVDKVRASLPDTPLVFIAIKPSIARWKLRDAMQEANWLIAEDCAADESLTFVDVWPAMLDEEGEPRAELFRSDGLHLNTAGYKLWTELLAPALTAAHAAAP
ncbi:MAG TPA: SGNH/GDSL hydrolase family protein [Lacipirellulaceae bacterium]|nr:SGNH/GDSL hydrolase family protein [Lacipirellulaceae bacterium]